MKKNYKNILKVTEPKLPKEEIIEKLLTYSEFWTQLSLTNLIGKKIETSKLN